MATLISRLRTLLLADAAVSALVGASRIHAAVAPQREARPFVVLREITGAPVNSLDGSPASRLRQTRIQIDAYAVDYAGATALADAIEAVVAALQSPELNAFRIDGRDLYEDETQLANASRDYSVWSGWD